MSIELNIQNFRIIRNLTLIDPGKISIIIGNNESGKSSLVNAIRFAFTGEAYGRNGKDVKDLVTHGELAMAVKVKCGAQSAARTQAGGESLVKVSERFGIHKDLLPLLFDARLNGDGGSKHMKAFFASAGEARFNPVEHFKNDAEMTTQLMICRAAGQMQPKQIIQFAEGMRAQQKAPPTPVAPSSPPANTSAVAVTENAVIAAQAQVSQATAALNEVTLLGTTLLQIDAYLKAMAAYMRRKQEASKEDSLRGRRDALQSLANANKVTIVTWQKLVMEAFPGETGETVTAALKGITCLATLCAMAVSFLEKHPAPPSMPIAPVLPEGAQATMASLEATGSPVAEQLPHLSYAATIDAEERRKELAAANATLEAARATHADLQRSIGAWEQYEKSRQDYDQNAEKAKAAWNRWDRVAKDVAAAEIEHNNKVGDTFGMLVSKFGASILNGRKLQVSDQGIHLNLEPIEDLSESTKWRVEIAVMAAIAHTLKAPLLLIDGADILDLNNREAVNQFLAESITPHFEHVIITLTPRGRIEDETASETPGVTRYLLSRGALAPLLPSTTAAQLAKSALVR
jgi:hypothetical protein